MSGGPPFESRSESAGRRGPNATDAPSGREPCAWLPTGFRPFTRSPHASHLRADARHAWIPLRRLCLRREVQRMPRVERHDRRAHAQPRRGLHHAADGLGAGGVPGRARQPATLRPTPVPVHDAGDVEAGERVLMESALRHKVKSRKNEAVSAARFLPDGGKALYDRWEKSSDPEVQQWVRMFRNH